jgi:gliding motility-associated-like protein
MHLIFCYKENHHFFSKYKGLLIIFFTVAISNSKAQQVIVPTLTSTVALTNPFGGTATAFSDIRYQYILYASELSGAGLSANDILTSIGYNITAVTAKTYVGLTISLKATNATTLTTWDAIGLTQVCSGNQFIQSLGWFQMSFSSNFVWNGSSNLLVSVCWNNALTSLGSSVQALGTGITGRAIFNQATMGIGCSLTTTTQSQNVPKTLIGYTAPPNPPSSASANPSSICSSQSSTLSVTGAVGTTYWFAGSCENSITNSIGSGVSLVVSPTATTTYYARNYLNGLWSSNCASTTIYVNTPSVPNNPTSNSPQCTSVTITRSGTPPSGTTWYWQGTNANGTSTNLGSGSTYTASSSGTYYIRALNSSSGCWSSTSGSISVSITSTTSAPNNPTSNSPQCSLVTITHSGTPPSGTTWYWQGTNANGTSTSLGSGATYTTTTSGTYYLRAQNSAGCWSNSSASIAVSISNTPQAPNKPTSNSPQCDFVTITRSGTPPSGTTWFWQGQTEDGTSTALGSDSTYSVASSGTYYIRAQNITGCWSDSSSSIVVIQECEIKIPIAISPNGDLLNDTWDIVGIDQIEDFKIEIFDLSGNLVYAQFGTETNGVYTPFVGKNNNDVDIIDGDYIYSLKSKNKNLKYAGILTIKRN